MVKCRKHDRKAYMRSVYYTLNVRFLGKPVSFIFSLESWCFPRRSQGKHQDSRENKTNCFSRDLTLSVYYYICKFGLSHLTYSVGAYSIKQIQLLLMCLCFDKWKRTEKWTFPGCVKACCMKRFNNYLHAQVKNYEAFHLTFHL